MSKDFYLVCPRRGWAVFIGNGVRFEGRSIRCPEDGEEFTPYQSDAVCHALNNQVDNKGYDFGSTNFSTADVALHMLYCSQGEPLYVIDAHAYCALLQRFEDAGLPIDVDIDRVEDLRAIDDDRYWDHRDRYEEIADSIFKEWKGVRED